MRLNAIDLNLLVALHVLLEERHVSRAAHRIGPSQPAMSNVLSRLRQLFNDELLLRTPNGLQPTARALALEAPLRLALQQLQQVVAEDDAFDQGSAHRSFTLGMSDYPSFVLLPALHRRLKAEAPGIDLVVVNAVRQQGLHLVETAAVDLAVGAILEVPRHLRSQVLYTDHLVCMARRGHPALRQPLTLDTFCSVSHVTVSGAADPYYSIERILGRLGRTRHVGLSLPHLLVVPMLLATSDLVACMPQRLADVLGDAVPLDCTELPFEMPDVRVSASWHSRNEADPAHRWLRRMVLEALRAPQAPFTG